ncbi:hypothetical protein B0H34DRAFT_782497 [Crassisporium funariophilum]|nr:hypothetical protein B0H34DRAFT_782497 [Crassisporium funariophilum]
MPFCIISRDVKIAAIRLYEQELLDPEDIWDCCGFARRTWHWVLKLWRETGDVVPHRNGKHGWPRILDHNPDYFLDELLSLLKTNHFISVHYTTIYQELERLNVSQKKLRKIAIERDELWKADFVARMAQYQPEELCFNDKMSRDARSIGRRYGRSQKNCPTTVVEGSMTRELFVEFLEQKVVSFVSLLHISSSTHQFYEDPSHYAISRTK